MTGEHGLFSGTTVVDLAQLLSGPLNTMIPADLDAEVIRIEHPDRLGASGPFLDGEWIHDLFIQHSKKSITLNLRVEEDRRVLMKLIRQANILIKNFKPGTMERMGFDCDVVSSVSPRIIHMTISDSDCTGPYREWGALDMVIQDMSDLMSLSGEPDGRPIRCGTSISDMVSGLYTFGAMVVVLYDREKAGNDRFIGVVMLDATFSCLENAVIDICITGRNPTRVDNSHPTSASSGTFPVLDGEIIIICSRDAAFYNLYRALNREDMIDDPRFSKAEARQRNRAQLIEKISRITSQYILDECEKTLEKFNVPNGRINTMTMICADPQTVVWEMIVEAKHPVVGKYGVAGNPIKFNQYPLTQYGPASTLGRHARQALTEYLYMSQAEINDLLAGYQPLCK